MVRRMPTVAAVGAASTAATTTTSSSSASTSPEDSSMKDGIFQEYNTTAPTEKSVLKLFDLRHRTAIVSGSDRGIGLQVARALAEAGANVAIWYHSNESAARARAAEIEHDFGVRSIAYQADVTSAEGTAALVRRVVAELGGRLDIFVANAGVPWTQGRMIDGELEHYRRVVETDFDSVFYSARAAGAVFREQYVGAGERGRGAGVSTVTGERLENYGGGSFIATASMSGLIANIPQFQAAYNAAKAGVIHLCRSLAVEWVKFARANSVAPGYMATEISDFIPPETKAIWRGKIPMGREGEAHELKGAYLFLASDASSYTTGTNIVVDGGYCSV